MFQAEIPGLFVLEKADAKGIQRIFIDSAPKIAANGNFVLSEFYGFNSSLNWRHISDYRLDGENKNIRAAGHDIVDFSLSKHLKSGLI